MFKKKNIFKSGTAGEAFWSEKFKGPNILINGPLLKRNSAYNNRVILLQPSIN